MSGDDTGGVTPVPIPNTAVKPVGPMIVPSARKSVIAGLLFEATSGGAGSRSTPRRRFRFDENLIFTRFNRVDSRRYRVETLRPPYVICVIEYNNCCNMMIH
jgi:hypothetical protein